SVGEKSENLQEVLEELANGYSQQVEIDLKMATSLIEPAIILVLGLILGAVIIAMLLPIFQMNLLAR
ncbi:MAG: type II secretion system F family protein, partial [Candidatus Omnitrophica bacterium]|nr:type II secretion system F family protein [Candidatus Omnitrophota bacterium]